MHRSPHGGPPWHEQVPPLQVFASRESQERPHPPQLSASPSVVLMHAPLQQLWVEGQTRPQAPQLPTLLLMSTHSPPQQRMPAAHGAPAPQRQVPPEQVSPMPQGGSQGTSVVQVPLRQACPVAQALPHAPQWVVLAVTSTQAPPQQACPAPHAGPAPHRQAPPSQVSPSPHAGSQGGATHSPRSQT